MIPLTHLCRSSISAAAATHPVIPLARLSLTSTTTLNIVSLERATPSNCHAASDLPSLRRFLSTSVSFFTPLDGATPVDCQTTFSSSSPRRSLSTSVSSVTLLEGSTSHGRHSAFNSTSPRHPFSTSPLSLAHRPAFYVRKPKKNMSHAVGKSRKPRISFMTKGAEEEEKKEYRKLLKATQLEFDSGKENEGNAEARLVESDSVETSLTEYRERVTTHIVSLTENAFQAQAAESDVTGDSSTIIWSPETREKIARAVGFLLKDGGVFPPDLIRFLTTGPTNPRTFCSLPEDRLVEICSRLVEVGLRDKSLLSVMWHDDLKVFSNPASRIYEALEFLREEGLAMSESLPTILIDCPRLLVDLDKADWRIRRDWFDHNFTSRSLREFLITQPSVLHRPLEELEEKFYYVYTEMGLDQKQMMESFMFTHKIDFIKCRHEFLSRCGFYKFPDPKRRVVNLNPHLRKILDWNDARFVTLVPGFELNDYRIFKKLFFQELEDVFEEEEVYDPEEQALEEEAAKRREEKKRNQQNVPGCFMAVGRRKGIQRYLGAND